MSGNIWEYRNKNISRETITEMSNKFSLPLIIAALLANRNIKSEAEVATYMTKSLKYIHNPLLLDNIETAAKRVASAIENHEKIMIYGDYDADGVTATVLLYSFLKSLSAEVEYYIPSRENEGYGINILAVNRFTKRDIKLMISVDCGITAVGEVELAKLQGMDVIITDHHTCQEKIPRADAVVNPKLPESEYPFDGLAGVGVAFKLILAVAMEMKLDTKECFDKYSYLAAIGTIADIVPLRDENRVIVSSGLKKIAGNPSVGVKELLNVAGLGERKVDNNTIAFGIAPRINAAGRMGNADVAVKLLLADNVEDAKKYAAELEEKNILRKKTEQEIFEIADSQIAKMTDFEKRKILIVSGENWHEGVIGIVASKICEKYYKPCFVISFDDDDGKGSARSVKDFNLFDAISSCSGLLTRFGGHSAAAGIGIKKDDLAKFDEEINKYAKEHSDDTTYTRKILIDFEISPKSVTKELVKAFEILEPFGTDNEPPLFSICKSRVKYASAIGVDGKHLKFQIEKDGISFDCIAFGMGDKADFLQKSSSVDIAFKPEINSFRGSENIQLQVKDLRIN